MYCKYSKHLVFIPSASLYSHFEKNDVPSELKSVLVLMLSGNNYKTILKNSNQSKFNWAEY